MKIAYLIVMLGIFAVLTISANGNTAFEFPQLMVILMNLIMVPPIVQWVKKMTPVPEIRAIIAGVFSFLTALIGILLAKQGSFSEIWKLLVLAYAVSQIAYNLWWHRLLTPEKK